MSKKNPIKQFHEIQTQIKSLEKSLKIAREAIMAALDASGKDSIKIGRYEAALSVYEQSRLDTARLKKDLGEDLAKYQRTTECVKLVIGGVG